MHRFFRIRPRDPITQSKPTPELMTHWVSCSGHVAQGYEVTFLAGILGGLKRREHTWFYVIRCFQTERNNFISGALIIVYAMLDCQSLQSAGNCIPTGIFYLVIYVTWKQKRVRGSGSGSVRKRGNRSVRKRGNTFLKIFKKRIYVGSVYLY